MGTRESSKYHTTIPTNPLAKANSQMESLKRRVTLEDTELVGNAGKRRKKKGKDLKSVTAGSKTFSDVNVSACFSFIFYCNALFYRLGFGELCSKQ